MARIYNRDNINYSGLIGQAIQNANQTSQLYANKYQPWNTMGQGVSDVGNRLQEAGWKEFGSQQDDARAKAMQQRQFEQQEKMLKEQQEFQALESARARAQQIFTNTQNAQNAERLAAINKGYASIDQYNDAQDKQSLINDRIATLTALRNNENEGSTEWNKYNDELNQENRKLENMQRRMDLALAQKNYADALLTNDPVAIAKAEKDLAGLYPTARKTQLPPNPPAPPAPPQGDTTQTDTPTDQTSVTPEDNNAKNPQAGVSWSKVGESQIAHLPKQFKTDADIEKAKSDASTIKDANIRQKVVDAIDKIADKGTIEGNNAKLIAKYDGKIIREREWDAMSEDEKKSILKLMKRSGTGKLTKR